MQIKISGYKPYTNKSGVTNPGCIPFDTDLITELQKIKDGSYADIIAKCRAIEDHAERNVFKAANLPSLTISAICNGWRNEANVVSHTGFLTFDIDQDHNPNITDWAKLRDEIFASDKVVAAFLSASGKGLAFIIKVLPSQHKDVFYSIEMEFLNLLNIVLDRSGKDIVRLRFISYDPDLRIKEDIQIIEITLPNEDYLKSKKKGAAMNIKYSSSANSWQTFSHAIKFANEKWEFIDGSKHYHLIHVASYCNSVGMDIDFCKNMAVKYYSDKTTVSDNAIIKPIDNTYKTYKAQFSSKQLPKPPYTSKELRWLLDKISKPVLKRYIYEFGKETFIGEKDYTIEVPSKLLAFIMWIIAPEYTWTVNKGQEVFTIEECKDTIPKNAYLDSCNGSRVWCCKINNYPLNWNI